MKDTDLHPVVCTADIPAEILNDLLTHAYAEFTRLVPGGEPQLVLVDAADLPVASLPTLHATDISAGDFLNASLVSVVEKLSHVRERDGAGINAALFCVLDQRTLQDKTCLLVEAMEVLDSGRGEDKDENDEDEDEGEFTDAAIEEGRVTLRIKTVRATFDQVQTTLVSLQMGTTGMPECQDIAEETNRVLGQS